MKYLLCILFLLSSTTLSANELIIVHAEWCNPCKSLKRFIEQEKQNIKYDIFYVNFDKEKELAQQLNVTKVPTSFIFDDNGKLISKKVGFDSSYRKWLEENE